MRNRKKQLFLIEYRTYNAFDNKLFITGRREARRICDGLRSLAHVTTVKEPIENTKTAKKRT